MTVDSWYPLARLHTYRPICASERLNSESPTERADKAAAHASQWHQGSGIHADYCASLADRFEEEGHLDVANLWADAAEAEAKHLAHQDEEDAWDPDKWNQSDSAKATAIAIKASKAVDPEFEFE